ncbi:MAG TPA: hypothetical protein PKL94_02795 [Saprospiraceae bacterium]|nr:hypothetical protein [Saprospiraceae bacterium]HNL28877.1 hypothetical protein [Saprospiraceae bacterium]
MSFLKNIIVACLLFFGTVISLAQKAKMSEIYEGNVFHIALSYGYQLPLADMKDIYGNNFNVGLSFEDQLKNNYLFGLEGQFLFGKNVKPDVLINLKDDQGIIYGNDKTYGSVVLRERGWYIQAYAGKIIPLNNPRSGVKLKLGAGYFQHKIRLQDDLNTINQIKAEYRKGYDRLTFGLGLSPYVGYQYISNDKRINYNIGIESIIGLTEGRRDYQFDTMSTFRSKRLDVVIGIKAGWILPFFTDVPAESYYY